MQSRNGQPAHLVKGILLLAVLAAGPAICDLYRFELVSILPEEVRSGGEDTLQWVAKVEWTHGGTVLKHNWTESLGDFGASGTLEAKHLLRRTHDVELAVPTDKAILTWDLMNAGDNEIGKGVRELGEFADGKVPLVGTLTNLAAGNCDGLVASGIIVATKADIDAAPVQKVETHTGTDTKMGCGDNSLYVTTITLSAVKPPEEAEVPEGSCDAPKSTTA